MQQSSAANGERRRALWNWCKSVLSASSNSVSHPAPAPEVADVLPSQIPEPEGFQPKWPKKSDFGLDPKISEQRKATLEVLELIAIQLDSNELNNKKRLQHAERILEYAENLESRYQNASSEFIARYSVPSSFDPTLTRLHFRWQEDPEVMVNMATLNAIKQAKKLKAIIPKLRADAMKVEFSEGSVDTALTAPSGQMHPDAINYDVSATILSMTIRMLDPDTTENQRIPAAFRR